MADWVGGWVGGWVAVQQPHPPPTWGLDNSGSLSLPKIWVGGSLIRQPPAKEAIAPGKTCTPAAFRPTGTFPPDICQTSVTGFGPELTLDSGNPMAAGCEGNSAPEAAGPIRSSAGGRLMQPLPLPEAAGCDPFLRPRPPDAICSSAGGRRMRSLPLSEAAGCTPP